MTSPIRVAVVTGGHPYDVPGFTHFFRDLPDVDAYIQHMEDFVTDPAEKRDWYDIVLFYHMLMETPTSDSPWYMERALETLGRLGETEQGIVMLHHSLVAFPEWPLWHDLVGIKDYAFKDYHLDQTVRIEVANPDHPITQGLPADWEMPDETYEMSEPDRGNEILLTLDHPQSMRACAWTHTYRNARVFCLQSGHDDRTYTIPAFQRTLSQALRWCARRI